MINMYRTLLRAFVPCVLLSAAPMLLQCGGSASIGTETGNPPGIARQKLYLEVTAGGLRIVGRAGAIAPPGSSVRVTNLRTGVSVEARAGDDGSLDAVVAGELGDEIQVTLTSGGVEVSESVSFAEIARLPDLAGVSCQGLESTLTAALNEVFESADTTCATDLDCAYVGWGAGASCYYQCGQTLLSTTGTAEVQAVGVPLTAPVCDALQACDRPAPSSCPFPALGLPVCRAGECQTLDPDTSSCDDVLTAASDRRQSLVAAVDRVCSVDSDCELADVSARCLVSCGPGVSAAQAASQALESNIQNVVDGRLCRSVLDRGCPYALPDCEQLPGTPEAFCESGTCEVRYIDLTGQ
jgi:hypothetical protein